MAQFDESKAYASQEDVFFDDGRETELLRFIYDKPNIDEIRGSPEKVLAAIDEFGRTQKYLMNVGEDKGKIVSNLIAEVKPETMVCNPIGPSQPYSLADGQGRSNLVGTLVTLASCLATPYARLAASATGVWSVILSLAQ